MKILLLSDADSIHTVKWAVELYKKGITIAIFSLTNEINQQIKDIPDIRVYTCHNTKEFASKGMGTISKLKYLSSLNKVKKLIKRFKPDILHSHYASSYGLLGALSGFHPFIISVWGSDIYDFPVKSFIHKRIIRYNLSKADKILSTSKVMAKETRQYTSKNVEVTPFGVNTDVFKKLVSEKKQTSIRIGTIKALETKYGIEYLLNAFKMLDEQYKNSDRELELYIVGTGSLYNSLHEQTRMLGIEKKVIFAGKVPHSEIPSHYNSLDIYVALSTDNSESFGVAIVEASACELPVVVSNVGGLPEVVENGVTGFVVEPKNAAKAAEKIDLLIKDKNLREEMGKKGRMRVLELYDFNKNVDLMISLYHKLS